MARPKKYLNQVPRTIMIDVDQLERLRQRLLKQNINLVAEIKTDTGLIRYLIDKELKK